MRGEWDGWWQDNDADDNDKDNTDDEKSDIESSVNSLSRSFAFCQIYRHISMCRSASI